MRHVIILVSSILLIFSPLLIKADNKHSITIKYPKFIIKVPDNIIVRKIDHEDFYVLEFNKNKKNILSAYVGNHPDVDNIIKKTEPDKITSEVKGWNIVTSKKDIYSGNYILKFVKVDDWPEYIHFYYSDTTMNDYKIIKKIIESVIYDK